MENSNRQIPHILRDLIILLGNNDEKHWKGILETCLDKFISGKNKSEVAREIIHLFHGGMGSFNDLVLQRGIEMSIEENSQLEKLKKELFNSCLELL